MSDPGDRTDLRTHFRLPPPPFQREGRFSGIRAGQARAERLSDCPSCERKLIDLPAAGTYVLTLCAQFSSIT